MCGHSVTDTPAGGALKISGGCSLEQPPQPQHTVFTPTLHSSELIITEGRTVELTIIQGLIGMRCVACIDIQCVVIFFLICVTAIGPQKGNFLYNSNFA